MKSIIKIILLTLLIACVTYAGEDEAPPTVNVLRAPQFVPGFPILSGDEFLLMWRPVEGADKYIIYLNGKYEGVFEKPPCTIPVPVIKKTTSFKFTVIAVNSDGEESPPSKDGYVNVFKEKDPNVTFRFYEDVLHLTWRPVLNANIYYIDKSDSIGGPFKLIATTKENRYVDTAVTKTKLLKGLKVGEWSKPIYYKVYTGPHGPKKKITEVKIQKEPEPLQSIFLNIKIMRSKEVSFIKPMGSEEIKTLYDAKFLSDKQTIVYTDPMANAIVILDKSGKRVRTIGEKGPDPDQFTSPFKLCVDEQDIIYVTDPIKSRFFAYNAKKGDLLYSAEVHPIGDEKEIIEYHKLTGPFNVSRSGGVAVYGDKLYIVEKLSGTVQIYKKSNGEFIDYFRVKKTGKIAFFPKPVDLLLDSESKKLYIGCHIARKIIAADIETGETLYLIEGSKKFNGAFMDISGLGLDKDKNLIVSDRVLHIVQVFFKEDGSYMYHIGGEKAIPDPKSKEQRPLVKNMHYPTAVNLDKDGKLWIYIGSKKGFMVREYSDDDIWDSEKDEFDEIDIDINTLLSAVRRGNIKLIDFLLKKGIDVNDKTESGYTALMTAASSDNPKIVKLLIDAGADVNAETEHGQTALMIAATYNNRENVKLLLDAGAKANKKFLAKDNNKKVIAEDNNFFVAVRYGDTEKVKLFLKIGADINAKDKNDQTALMIATLNNIPETVKLLIDAGADVNAETEKGETALFFSAFNNNQDITKMLFNAGAKLNEKALEDDKIFLTAVRNSNDEMIKLLIEKGADVNAKTSSRDEAVLIEAAGYSEASTLRLLIDAGADVNVTNRYGRTPLMAAAHNNKIRNVKVLLGGGADVNAKTKNYRTALMEAASEINTERIIRLLINAGADINAKDEYGNTAFMTLVKKANLHEIKFLIYKGADVSAKNRSDITVLMEAIEYADSKVIDLLIENGADVNAKSDNGWTALMMAAASDNKENFMLLIENGADTDVINIEGETVLMWAAGRTDPEIISFLIEKGADVNAKSHFGKTALIFAAEGGKAKNIKLLLDNGADVNAKRNDGKTALIIAVEQKKAKAVKILLDAGADVDIADYDGKTALMYAKIANWNFGEITKLLEAAGAKE